MGTFLFTLWYHFSVIFRGKVIQRKSKGTRTPHWW